MMSNKINIQKILYDIKKSRMSPPELFLYKIFIKRSLNGTVYFLHKNGECVFRHDKKHNDLWCSYSYIWSVLETKYHLDRNKIGNLIIDVANKTLNSNIKNICINHSGDQLDFFII